MSKKNILLINSFGMFSPSPPYATAYLTGLLRSEDYIVNHIDVNNLVWNYILSVEFLEKICRKLNIENTKIVISKLSSVHKTLKDDLLTSSIETIRSSIKDLDYILTLIERFLEIKITPKQIKWNSKYNINTINQEKSKSNFSHSGNKILSLGFINTFSQSESNNPLFEIYSSCLYDVIQKNNVPDIIFLEALVPWEIIQLSTLARWLKSIFPDSRICFSGIGFDEMKFARVDDKISNIKYDLLGFDSIFLTRNDNAILKLLKSNLFDIEALKKIENLMFKINRDIFNPQKIVSSSTNNKIIPDYSDLDLEKYLSPKIVLYERTNARCYWSKCNFCAINSIKSDNDEFDVNLVIHRLRRYINNYNCTNVIFYDEAVHPKFANRLSELISEHKLAINWSIRTRIDEGFSYELLKKMHKSGCRELWIGLESGSKSMLRTMNKCLCPDEYIKTAESITENCHKLGIGLHFCLLFGFPGEEEEDREETLSFIKKTKRFYKNKPLFISFNTFGLIKGSPIYEEPNKFGISAINDSNDIFSMDEIPFVMFDGKEHYNHKVRENIESYYNKITKELVENENNTAAWYFLCDTAYELLIKSSCDKNFFLTKN